MKIEEEIYQRSRFDFTKLLSYGFERKDEYYIYSTNIMKDTFRVDIIVTSDGTIMGKIYDISFGEEYNNYRMENQTGKFVSQVREEFKHILYDIKSKCTTDVFFLSEQANRIAYLIHEKYGSLPDFVWEKFPGYGIFRNANNKKWYGIIMNIEKKKLNHEGGKVEIINVKLAPEKISSLIHSNGVYPAYHMNKKNWISIILDDTLSDSEIMKYIEESYRFTI